MNTPKTIDLSTFKGITVCAENVLDNAAEEALRLGIESAAITWNEIFLNYVYKKELDVSREPWDNPYND